MIKDKGDLNKYFEKVTMTIRARGLVCHLSYLMNTDCQAVIRREFMRVSCPWNRQPMLNCTMYNITFSPVLQNRPVLCKG